MRSLSRFVLLAVGFHSWLVPTIVFPNHCLSQGALNPNTLTVCVDARVDRGAMLPQFPPEEPPTAVTFELLVAPWDMPVARVVRHDDYVHRFVKIDLPHAIPDVGDAICLSPPCEKCGVPPLCTSDGSFFPTPICRHRPCPHEHVSVWIYRELSGRLNYRVVFCNIPNPREHPVKPNAVGIRQRYWREAGNWDLPWVSFWSSFGNDMKPKVGLLQF